MPTTPYFQLSQVSKIYRKGFFRKKQVALQHIDLSIEDGEAVGFIGHNGAGKSSTIRILLGLQAPTTGTALILGQAAQQPEARRGIGYVPEVPLVYDFMTPRELLAMSLALHHVAGDHQRRIATWLDKLSLGQAADKRVKGFSKGMVQRTALAMALCTDPLALVLDEPLSGLDPIGRREIVEILEEYRQGGRTLFFSSHVLSDVERLADRFLFIHGGQICASHSVASVLGASGGSYDVTVSAAEPLPGYRAVGRMLWQKTVSGGEAGLVQEIQAVTALGGQLHSVRGAANIEKLYVNLVREQSALHPPPAA